MPLYRRVYILQPMGLTRVLIDPGGACKVHVLNARVGEADDINFDAGQAGLHKAELFRGLLRNIDDPIANAGASIVNLDQCGFMVPEVGDANCCTKRKFWVGGSKLIFIKRFPARSL